MLTPTTPWMKTAVNTHPTPVNLHPISGAGFPWRWNMCSMVFRMVRKPGLEETWVREGTKHGSRVSLSVGVSAV